jgi:hypothetical protein
LPHFYFLRELLLEPEFLLEELRELLAFDDERLPLLDLIDAELDLPDELLRVLLL